MEDLKGNSNAQKIQSSAPPKHYDTITTNINVIKKASEDKNKKHFFAQDARTVGQHVMDVVIVPGLQRIFSDIVKQGIDWLIYGSKGTSNPNNGLGNVSYNRYYSTPSQQPQMQYQPYTPRTTIPTPYAVNGVIFNERADAEVVLSRLQEAIAKYGMVSVGDFYDMVNQHCEFTDQKWGWVNLDGVEIVRYQDAYCINFPPVRPIE